MYILTGERSDVIYIRGARVEANITASLSGT